MYEETSCFAHYANIKIMNITLDLVKGRENERCKEKSNGNIEFIGLHGIILA